MRDITRILPPLDLSLKAAADAAYNAHVAEYNLQNPMEIHPTSFCPRRVYPVLCAEMV